MLLAHFTYGSNWGDALQAVLQAVLQAGPIVRCFGRDLLPAAEVTAALALLEAEGRASFFRVEMTGTAADGHSGNVKRRKTTSANDAIGNLTDLSGDTLAAIADFLPKTSRALLAVALTAPSSAWRGRGWTGKPSEAATAILASVTPFDPFSTILEMNCSELKDSKTLKGWEAELAREKQLQKRRMEEYYGQGGWEILDFMDIEADLASKLTDDDIGATLSCIDARSKLRKLYLTKCSSLVGRGLEPLRGSSALGHIDLDIVHMSSIPDKKPNDGSVSLEVVFPILGDILAGDITFRCMQVPPNWLVRGRKESEQFVKFLESHKHTLNVSAECCYFGFDGTAEEFCRCYREEQQLAPKDRCRGCGESNYTTCADCNAIMCTDFECRINCFDAIVCDQCDKTSCSFCIKDGSPSVTWCDCDVCDTYCDDCRYISCRGGDNDCQLCKGLVFDRLLQESTVQGAEMDRLRIENMELRQAQA